MSDVLSAVIRRAILDLLADIGGEVNDDRLTMLLNQLAHGVARRDVAAGMRWLGERGLVRVEELGRYVVAEIEPDGIDAAAGRLRIEGISRHRTGQAAGTARG